MRNHFDGHNNTASYLVSAWSYMISTSWLACHSYGCIASSSMPLWWAAGCLTFPLLLNQLSKGQNGLIWLPYLLHDTQGNCPFTAQHVQWSILWILHYIHTREKKNTKNRHQKPRILHCMVSWLDKLQKKPACNEWGQKFAFATKYIFSLSDDAKIHQQMIE